MKKILLLIVMMVALIATVNVNAQNKAKDGVPLTMWDADSVIADAASDYVYADFDYSYSVHVVDDTVSGAVDGELYIQVSNDGVNWVNIDTVTTIGTLNAMSFTGTSSPYFLRRLYYNEVSAAGHDFLFTLLVRKIID